MRKTIFALLLMCSTAFSFYVFLGDQNSSNQFLVKFIPMSGYTNPDPWGAGVNTPSTVDFPEPVWAGKMIATRAGFVPDTVDTVLYTSTSLQIVYFNLQPMTSVKVQPVKEVKRAVVSQVYYDISGRRVSNGKTNAVRVVASKSGTIVTQHNHR